MLSKLVAIIALGMVVSGHPGIAVSATFVSGSQNIFRDTRGINDVAGGSGDLIQFGANISGGSAGWSGFGSFVPTGGIGATINQSAIPCGPLSSSPNFCARTTPFSSDVIDGTWTFTATKSGDTISVVLPSLVGAESPVPFPTTVSITGTGVNPTVSFALPAGYVPDGFRVQIFDKSVTTLNGTKDIIHSVAIPANSTSYTIPTTLSTGQTLKTDGSGNYAINFQVIETRGNVPFTAGNSQILARSNSFFSFKPLTSDDPAFVYLPMVGTDTDLTDDRGAPYVFHVDNVGPDSITFIDPVVAIGYEYAIGAGDPNFASVKLPEVGDNKYVVCYEVSGAETCQLLDANAQFFFPQGGVERFIVSGIEVAAGLDPSDGGAFITGLTFVTPGDFTGTMTPIVVDTDAIPEPATLALLGVGLATLLARRRSGRGLACAA